MSIDPKDIMTSQNSPSDLNELICVRIVSIRSLISISNPHSRLMLLLPLMLMLIAQEFILSFNQGGRETESKGKGILCVLISKLFEESSNVTVLKKDYLLMNCDVGHFLLNATVIW